MSAQSEQCRPEIVRGLQERAARALPAEYVERDGGWWLRHAPRCSWWAAAVLPHGDAESPGLHSKVVAAEEFYAERDAVARFQISPGACPDDLDALLAERGYRRVSPISVQAASVADAVRQAQPGAVRILLDEHLTNHWMEAWYAVQGHHGGDLGSENDMLARVSRPCAYAIVMDGDEVVAVGRAVADNGWAGVFSMATLPHARGKGAARAILGSLATWAGAHEIDRMYLQVENENPAALRLYGRAGFNEVFGYHYRTAE